MPNAAERIKSAVEVLGTEHEGAEQKSLREQAEVYLGAEVDDEAIKLMITSALATYAVIFTHTSRIRPDQPIAADQVAMASVLLVGMAIGKRMGMEDGEAFGRMTAGLEDGVDFE